MQFESQVDAEKSLELLQHTRPGFAAREPVIFARKSYESHGLMQARKGVRHGLGLGERHDRVITGVQQKDRDRDALRRVHRRLLQQYRVKLRAYVLLPVVE